MSTDFRPQKSIAVSDLFDGRLEPFGIREHAESGTISPDTRCLVDDGENYLTVFADDAGFVGCMSRYGAFNNPGHILGTITDVFETDIFSEYEPQYWGFETQEEWENALDKLAKENDDRYYGELVKFLAGEPCGIRPRTIGMQWAEIARELVKQNPELAAPANKAALLDEVRTQDRDHA